MRVVCIARKDAKEGRVEQGFLNGGSMVLQALIRMVPEMHVAYVGSTHTGAGTIPEIGDLEVLSQVRDIAIDYDRVVTSEIAFLPMLSLLEKSTRLIANGIWLWEDGTAHVWERFMPFLDEVIAVSPEVASAFRARGVPAHLAYPTVEECFFRHRSAFQASCAPYVVWVGREGPQKNPEALYRIAAMLPGVSFHMLSSTEVPPGAPENVVVHVGQIREFAVDTIRGAAAMLCTSRFETFNISVAEALVSGARVVLPHNAFGMGHFHAAARTYVTDFQAADAVGAALHYGRDADSIICRKFREGIQMDHWRRAILESP